MQVQQYEVCSMPPKEKKGKKKKTVEVAEPPHDPTWDRVSSNSSST